MQSFRGVSVSFPGGSNALYSREDWRSVPWPHWSTGELRVDTESLALVVVPQGCDHFRAKPFGCLTGALQADPLDTSIGACTFITSTSDPVHSLIRLGFSSQDDDARFAQLAQAAEQLSAARHSSRRSTLCTGRRSRSGSGAAAMRDMALMEAITDLVRVDNPDAWPLVYPGAELYGGEGGAQVLVACGGVVLLDRPDANRLGEYWLAFYEEGSNQATLTIPIGPRMKIAQHSDTGLDMHPGAQRPSMGGCSRESIAWGGAPTVFRLSVPGHQSWDIGFERKEDAEGFARDFDVRHRLTALSLKTARGQTAVGELQQQLQDIRSRGIIATLRWLSWQAVKLVCLVMLFYGGAVYLSDTDKPVIDVVTMTVADVFDSAFVAVQRFHEAGTFMCALVTPAQVPQAELDRCLALADVYEARSCARALTTTA